jgi:hypothetical protein
MSTRRIKEALDLLGRTRTYDLGMVAELLPAARAEVEAIEMAALVWSSEDLTPEKDWDDADRTMRRIGEESSK